MKKRKRRPAREPVTEHRTRYQREACPFDFADAVWHDDRGRHWPALTYSGRLLTNWGATLIAKRPEITKETTDRFVRRMFETSPDFVFTVTREFVRSCPNPVLILPDEVPAHPYAVAMECVMLAPNAEVSIFPWK